MNPPALPAWIARRFPPGMQRRMVDVGGVRMHVAIWDGPGPTVVLLHGNPTWSFLWRKVIAALQGDGLRIVAPGGTSAHGNVRLHSGHAPATDTPGVYTVARRRHR